MSMDGRFIEKLANELNDRIGNGRINKIYQLSKSDFLFVVRSSSKTESLYLSVSPQIARIHLTDFNYDKPQSPTGFCMLLRKYLENGQIKQIEALNFDRIVQITIENSNDFGEKVIYKAIVEIMGKHANFIVTDEQNMIIDCYKHVSPFEGQQRTFLKGFTYELPQDGKISPNSIQDIKSFFELNDDHTSKALTDKVRGLSPLFSEYIYRQAYQLSKTLIDCYIYGLNQTVNPCLITIHGKRKFTGSMYLNQMKLKYSQVYQNYWMKFIMIWDNWTAQNKSVRTYTN